MPSHELVPEKLPYGGRWLVAWDELALTVRDPDGAAIIDVPVERVHRIILLYELDAEGKVGFNTSEGPLTFKPDKAAARDVRELVVRGLRTDAPFRAAQKRWARIVALLGAIAFVICGGLFALYCWWASWAPDPPKGHWLYFVGPLIHLGLVVLLGLALAGPYVAFLSWRQLRRIRAAERTIVKGPAT